MMNLSFGEIGANIDKMSERMGVTFSTVRIYNDQGEISIELTIRKNDTHERNVKEIRRAMEV